MTVLKCFITLIFAIFTEVAAEQVHYTHDWIAVNGDSPRYTIHRHFTEQIAKGRFAIDVTDSSNIAYFGMTVVVDNTEHFFVFPSVVSSALDSKDYPKILKPTKTELVTVTDLLRPSDPMLTPGATSKTAHLKTLLQHISECTNHSFNDLVLKIMPWLDKKIATGFMLGLVGDVAYGHPNSMSQTDKASLKTCNVNLGALLHCEQMMLLKCINDGVYINMAMQKALKDVVVDECHPIQKITFDIFTYNDMCRNCYSTCFNFYENILKKINIQLQALCIEPPVTPANFKIYISCVRPYTISQGVHTRTPFKRDLYEFVLSHPCHNFLEEETEETKVIQFFNPWMCVATIIEDLNVEIASIQNLTLVPNIVALVAENQQRIDSKRTKLSAVNTPLSEMVAACGKTEEISQLLQQIDKALKQKKNELINVARQIISGLTT